MSPSQRRMDGDNGRKCLGTATQGQWWVRLHLQIHLLTLSPGTPLSISQHRVHEEELDKTPLSSSTGPAQSPPTPLPLTLLDGVRSLSLQSLSCPSPIQPRLTPIHAWSLHLHSLQPSSPPLGAAHSLTHLSRPSSPISSLHPSTPPFSRQLSSQLSIHPSTPLPSTPTYLIHPSTVYPPTHLHCLGTTPHFLPSIHLCVRPAVHHPSSSQPVGPLPCSWRRPKAGTQLLASLLRGAGTGLS